MDNVEKIHTTVIETASYQDMYLTGYKIRTAVPCLDMLCHTQESDGDN